MRSQIATSLETETPIPIGTTHRSAMTFIILLCPLDAGPYRLHATWSRLFVYVLKQGLAVGLWLVAASSGLFADPAYRAVLDKYCVTCHNQRLKTGGLTLDNMDLEGPGPGRSLGKSCPQVAIGHHAPGRVAAARRGYLLDYGRLARSANRSRFSALRGPPHPAPSQPF